MRQLFPGLNVSHRHEHNLSLDSNIGVTRVIAKDHPTLSLVFRPWANKEPIGHEDFCRSERRCDALPREAVKNIAALDRHNLIFSNWGYGKEAPAMNRTFSDRRLWREVS
jgi:hypothetical protein